MPITAKAPSVEFDSEIDRKVVDAIEKLTHRYESGQISEHMFGEAISAVYMTAYGLTQDPFLPDFMDGYEPEVRNRPGYFRRMRKLNEMVFVIWRVDSQYVEIHVGSTMNVKRIDIKKGKSPHKVYNEVIEAMCAKGWEFDE